MNKGIIGAVTTLEGPRALYINGSDRQHLDLCGAYGYYRRNMKGYVRGSDRVEEIAITRDVIRALVREERSRKSTLQPA